MLLNLRIGLDLIWAFHRSITFEFGVLCGILGDFGFVVFACLSWVGLLYFWGLVLYQIASVWCVCCLMNDGLAC